MIKKIVYLISLFHIFSASHMLANEISIDDQNIVAQKGQCSVNHSIIEIWKHISGNHEIHNENIVFIELLLAELNVDTEILDMEDQIRLSKSIDMYLNQFAFHFINTDKNAQEHCYWLAWLISNGVKRKPISKKEREALRASYEEFFDEVILDINIRILQKNGVDNYAKYNDQIHTCSKWTKEALSLYYSNLNEDFLFPAFKSPIFEKNKKASLGYIRKFDEVPIVSKPTKMLVLEEEIFVKDLRNYFKDVPKMLTYMITLRTIWEEFHKTVEWGYMDSSSRTCSAEMGKWPIDVKFCPDHDFNRIKALEEKELMKKKGKK